MDIINSVREKADAGLTKDLLIYTGPGSDYGLSLALRIKTTIRPSAFITEDLSVLTERVSKPKLKPLIVLLVASSDEDLNDLLKLKDWLEDAKVILILPSDGWGWIDQAHRLHPRYLGYTDEDQGWVTQVLEKILSAEYR